jgi:predicted permease
VTPSHRTPWTAALVPGRYRDAVVGDALEEMVRRGGTSRLGNRLWIHGFLVRAAAAAWWQRLSARSAPVHGASRSLVKTASSPSILRSVMRGLGDASSDTRHALRQLRRSPWFTTVATLSLALGIGANIAIFSVMDAMLLRSLPVADPQQLVEFVQVTPDGAKMTNLRYPVFEFFRDDHRTLSDLFAFWSRSAVFRTGSGSRRITAHTVSGSFFPALGVSPILGRPIGRGDDRPSAAPVVLLSYSFWSRQYGRDPAVLGSTVRIDGQPAMVIGVMPAGFFGVDRSRAPDAWVPLSSSLEPGYVWLLGRLKPGFTVAQARAELEPLFRRALDADGYDDFESQQLEVNRATAGTSGLRWSYWEYSSTLRIVLGLTGLVLLIACVNLATLLTARSAARTREIGIRLAIGAGRWRTARQWITENLLLAVLGGALGLLVAAWGHRLLVQFLTNDTVSGPLDFRLDLRLLGAALAISLTTGLVFSIVPSLYAARGDPLSPIRGATRSGCTRRLPVGRALLTVQTALSLILLVGAGLFVRNLRKLSLSDMGFPPGNLALMTVDPSPSPTLRDPQVFWTLMLDRVRSLPEVRSASLAAHSVLGTGWNKAVWVNGAPKTTVLFNYVGRGFFETLGIPLQIGRAFGTDDEETTAGVVVVNEAFVRSFFGSANPLGARVRDRGPDVDGGYEIVGVVGDTRAGGPRQVPRPMLFQPIYHAAPDRALVLHVRTSAESAAALASIREEILSIDTDVVVYRVSTLTDLVTRQLGRDRMFATLAVLFGLLALLLVSIGLYGLMAWNVELRRHEIGTRMALGARPVDVARPILRDALLMTLLGAVLGAPAAYTAARLIRGTLFGIEPYDPVTLVGAVALLLTVTVVAAWIPSRRAARIDPMASLRVENGAGR